MILASKWYTLLAASDDPLHILEAYLQFGWNLPSLNRATSYRSANGGGGFYVADYPDREMTVWDKLYWRIFPTLPGVEGIESTSEYKLAYEPAAETKASEALEDAEAEPAEAEAD